MQPCSAGEQRLQGRPGDREHAARRTAQHYTSFKISMVFPTADFARETAELRLDLKRIERYAMA